MHNKINKFYMPDIFEAEFIYINNKDMKLKIIKDSDQQFIGQEIEFDSFFNFDPDINEKEKTEGIVILPPMRWMAKVGPSKAIVSLYNPQALKRK